MVVLRWWLAAAAVLLIAVPSAAKDPAGDPGSEALAQLTPSDRAKTLAFEKSLRPQQGKISLSGGNAELNLGEAYYFLPAEDAKRVLTEAWGNPPDSAGGVLGMVFPKGRHFYDGSWGAVLTYDDTGHVDDKDAKSEDYDAVMADMKSGAEEENEARKKAGYGAVHVTGWAQAPTYDPVAKTLIWARSIAFEGEQGTTLNYDVRKLGRTGVLSMNMVAGMDNLAEVRTAAGELSKTAGFKSDFAYADFNPSVDKVAEYGLAGLVAAGAGVAVAKKIGLLGLLLIFLKKGFIIVLAAGAGLWGWIKRKMGREEVEEAAAYDEDWQSQETMANEHADQPVDGPALDAPPADPANR